MRVWALVHVGKVIDVTETPDDVQPGRADLRPSQWIEVTYRGYRPKVGDAFDGASFTET